MVTPWEEEQLLSDVMDGLGAAIHDSQVNPEELNSIKLNKLLYLAVDEFDLPITRSWFLFGVSLGYKTDDVNELEPSALDDLPSPDEPSIGHSWDHHSPEEYAYFFKQDVSLEDIFREDTKEYLGEFYDGYAPDQYKKVYVSSARLQKSIDEMLQGDFTRDIDLEQEFQQLSTDILLNEDIDDEATESFNAYAHLVTDITDHVSISELSERQVSTLEDVLYFFYSHAWRYVALTISEKTAAGPNRRELLKGAVNDLDSLEKTYSDELEAVRHKAERDGILPARQREIAPVSMDFEVNPETVDSAFAGISDDMESRDYESIDAEQYMK